MAEEGCINNTNLHALEQLQLGSCRTVPIFPRKVNLFFPHNSFCLEAPIFPKIMLHKGLAVATWPVRDIGDMRGSGG